MSPRITCICAYFFLSTDFTDYTVFPRDTCDTWRQVNVPHGKQFNLFNLLTFLVSNVSRVSARIFLSTDCTDDTDFFLLLHTKHVDVID